MTLIKFHAARIHATRRFSSLLQKDVNALKLGDLHRVANPQDEQGRLDLIRALTASSNPDKTKLYQELVPGFSDYFKLKDLATFDAELLRQFIEINPRRVMSTLDLVEKHGNGIMNEPLVSSVMNQLVEEFVNEEANLASLQDLFHFAAKHNEGDLGHEALEQLLASLIERNDLESIQSLFGETGADKDACFQAAIQHLPNPTAQIMFVDLFKDQFSQKPEEIPAWVYEIALVIMNCRISDLQKTFGSKLDSKYAEYAALSDSVLHFINTTKLDLEPANLNLRTLVLEIHGIARGDMDTTLKKYSEYDAFAPLGIDRVKTTMVKVFTHQGIKENQEIYLSMAEAIQPPQTTITVLGLLVILKSSFNLDAGLRLYNEYINDVSDKVNDNRSAKGFLTEAIVLSFLMNNDREFAFLIFNKAVENRVIHDELDVARIKKWLKVYSDSFLDNETWSGGAEVEMKSQALHFVASMASPTLTQLVPENTADLL
ncbi:uncharacterized protein LODBEIA_P52840 [Lodderomyces beijingensis]|uniref:Uncharacterized protein n=1 Tax=Lodderomyces beijingensis TaxID=1775926 RepID=A0ABP0ZV23_9ASCO